MKGFDRRARERSELGGRGRGIAADGPRHTQPTQGWRDGGRGGFLNWRACERNKKYGCAGYLGFNKNNGLRPQKHADESALKNNASLKKKAARSKRDFLDSENNPKIGRKETENIWLRGVNENFLDSENNPKMGRNYPKMPTNGLARTCLREVERRFSL